MYFSYFLLIILIFVMNFLPRCLNELHDSNKMKRCAAYKKLSEFTLALSSSAPDKGRDDAAHPGSNGAPHRDTSPTAAHVQTNEPNATNTVLSRDVSFDIIRTCLGGLEDSSERCREEAVRIITRLLPGQRGDASVLDWVLPSIVARIGVSPVAETSEEVRLLLLQLASACMTVFPSDVGPRDYLDYFHVLLENCLADPFPELKKESCRVIRQLCAVYHKPVRAIALPLARALRQSALMHKHSAVRVEAVGALATLMDYGAAAMLRPDAEEKEREAAVKTHMRGSNAPHAASSSSSSFSSSNTLPKAASLMHRDAVTDLFILCNDHSAAVRAAVMGVLESALLLLREHAEYHTALLPLLLLLCTDRLESVRQSAQTLLYRVGERYTDDHLDDRIDLARRPVTLKDIAWYADEDEEAVIAATCQRIGSSLCRDDLTKGNKHNHNKNSINIIMENDNDNNNNNNSNNKDKNNKDDWIGTRWCEEAMLQSRPSLGSRHAVAAAARTFLPALLRDAAAVDWVIPFSTQHRRVVALRVLWATLWHCEWASVQFSERVLHTLYAAVRADGVAEVRAEAELCVRVLSVFVLPVHYVPIFARPVRTGLRVGGGADDMDAACVPDTDSLQPFSCNTEAEASSSSSASATRRKAGTVCADVNTAGGSSVFATAAMTTRCGMMMVLRMFLHASGHRLTSAQAIQLVQALTLEELLDTASEELVSCLLDTMDVLSEVLIEAGFVVRPTSSASNAPPPPSVTQRTLDAMLLTAMLILDDPEHPTRHARVQRSLALLSRRVCGSEHGIFAWHASRILTRYAATRLPSYAFAALVRRAAAAAAEVHQACHEEEDDDDETQHMQGARKEGVEQSAATRETSADEKEIPCKATEPSTKQEVNTCHCMLSSEPLPATLLHDLFVCQLTDVDVTSRIALAALDYAQVLQQLLWWRPRCPVAWSALELVDVVQLIVLPLATFRPQSGAHLFRKVAVNCLCALFRPSFRRVLSSVPVQQAPAEHVPLSDVHEAHHNNNRNNNDLASHDNTTDAHTNSMDASVEPSELSVRMITQWCSASDSDDGEVRLMCMTSFVDVCAWPMTAGAAHEVVQSLLLRLDDANETIRHTSMSGLRGVLREAAEGAKGMMRCYAVVREIDAQTVPLVRKLLTYLDDEDCTEETRAVIVSCVDACGARLPHIVLDLLRDATSRHVHKRYCQALTESITQRLAQG